VRIGIDATCWQDTRGFGRFTRELVGQLVEDHCGTHEFVLVADRRTADESDLPAGARVVVAETSQGATHTPTALDWRSPLDLLRLGRSAARCGADVFWFPAVASYYPVTGCVPVAVTFHDAMTEEQPELFFPTRRAHLFWQAKVWMACRQATTLVTPSESARQRVAAAVRWPVERVARIDEAPAAVFREVAQPEKTRAALRRYGLPDDVPIVLYVGGLNPHKNLATLLRAMARMHTIRPRGWHLAMVGEYRRDRTLSCYDQIVSLRTELGLDRRVTLTGFVPDEDLAILYNAASLLVQPSLDEGFGLPVVEAMACGLPVAVSRGGSLPGLVGNAGLTFDPRDPAAIAEAIGRLLLDAGLRRQFRARGLARVRNFTWRQSAGQLLAVLQATAER